jgi:hypothetical protein
MMRDVIPTFTPYATLEENSVMVAKIPIAPIGRICFKLSLWSSFRNSGIVGMRNTAFKIAIHRLFVQRLLVARDTLMNELLMVRNSMHNMATPIDRLKNERKLNFSSIDTNIPAIIIITTYIS